MGLRLISYEFNWVDVICQGTSKSKAKRSVVFSSTFVAQLMVIVVMLMGDFWAKAHMKFENGDYMLGKSDYRKKKRALSSV